MTADAVDDPAERRRRRWWERKRWRAMIALLLVFAVALGVLWSQRAPLAEGVVDRELARRGVPARYTIDSVGLSRQRLTNVAIGDPADPDLVADWVVVRTRVGLSGAGVEGIEAGHVRLRARLVDGRVTLGAIDRLLPPPSGKPFALPAIATDLSDVRLRIETPNGIVGARLSGQGRLDDGFSGRLALVAGALSAGDCTILRPRGAFALRVTRARPTIEGPARVGELRCGDAGVRALTADVRLTLGAALDRWTGRVRAAVGDATVAGVRTGQLMAQATFDGTARRTAGDVTLTAMATRLPGATAGTLRLTGRYAAGAAGAQFAGRVAGQDIALAGDIPATIAATARKAAGTPVAPLADAAARAVIAAGRRMSADATIAVDSNATATAVRVGMLALTSASGARATLDGPLQRHGAVEIGSRLRIAGGGLPDLTATVRRTAGGLAGTATIAPYAAGGARLALTPVTFALANGRLTRLDTVATLSGPLGDGRVDALRLPITARWTSGGALAINPACASLAWQRLAISGLVLAPGRLALCPIRGAMVTLAGGRIGGGARIGATQLTGRLGSTPLSLATGGARVALDTRGFILTDVRTRLGDPSRQIRIDAASVSGRIVGSTVTGDFTGASGQIGAVPLLLSDAAGTWRLVGGRLALNGALRVADAATDRRFEPLAGQDVALTLAANRIHATGTLVHPVKRVAVASVVIDHDLSAGSGAATLDVPGIRFDDRFQPNELTPITFGVIAEVKGTVSGAGRIAWTPAGVTSTGRFGTQDLDLAAAFGPVTGLTGTIDFTDLLGLVSAPHQIATIGTVNPGIAVENGTVRYQLVGNSRVQVEGGSWPFANGELLLEPTLLDFNANQERRMTFRVERADAATFLQQFDFDNLNATGTFDGVLPMTFDETGGRIADGRLAARSGGTIAYVGTITEKDVGVWGNMAFQALKSLNYRSLDITLNGPLAGEMVTGIRFAGVSQGAGTKSNFIIRRLARLPFVFNITIRAPFRQLLDSVRSYYDPSRLIERNLPALMEDRRRRQQGLLPTPPAIQPPDSETKP